jgi:hypothetical protein
MEVVRRDPWYRRALRFALGPRPAQIPVSIGATAVIAALTVYLYQHVPELQRAAWREAPPAVERIEPLTPVPAEPTEPSPAPGSPPPPAAFSSSTPARRPAGASPGGASAAAPVESSPRDRLAAERPGGEPAAGAPAPPGPKAEREEANEQRAAPAKELADATRSAAARPGALAAPEAPHLAGRLIVADRAAGLAALDRLAADLGATGLGRRPDSGATVVELAVPRSAYERLEPGLRAIGAWEPEPASAGLPHTVRVLVRVVPR